MIKIKNLSKYFSNTKVLNNINLEIKKGDIFAIVGHSGAGKSTLLRCINGLEKYEEGSLEVFSKEIKSLNENELRLARKEIGMIFQHFSLMQRKTVWQNISLPMQCWGYNKKQIKQKVNTLLKLVGLEDKKNSYPKELSGGQKQRVAIARALGLEPKILLSDEATSALDPKTTMSILELLKKINQTLGVTIVLVTHEMEVVKNIAKNSLLLEKGLVIGYGETENLFLQPNQKMKSFLGEEDVLPNEGINIKLYFPKNVANHSFITHMAIKLNINFNIVWGRLEKINEHVIGSLVINIEKKDEEKIINFIKQENINWEIIQC